MKKYIGMLFAFISILATALEADFVSTNNENEFLNFYNYSDVQELGFGIEYHEDLALLNEVSFTRDPQDSSMISCFLYFVPVSGTALLNSSGYQVTMIAMTLTTSTLKDPVESNRFIISLYETDDDGIARSSSSSKSLTIDEAGVFLNSTADPKIYTMVDDQGNDLKEIVIAFPVVTKAAKKNKQNRKLQGLKNKE